MGKNDTADWDVCACDREGFIELVRDEGARHYRSLPWRNIDDPYAVLVSEIMLQQTQVSRVLNYWPRWMAMFPTVDALASTSTSDVLAQWQGLGYNRRALALKRACDICSAEHAGEVPDTVEELVALPGIGPATAAGVVAFAHNKPSVYIETNVRSVFLHHLFPDRQKVSDKELAPYVADTCPQVCARKWYYALLDYGADLKSRGANPSRRSAHYSRQSTFEGSHREKRSFVLKCVLAAPEGIEAGEVRSRLAKFDREAGRDALDPAEFARLLDEMVSEGFFSLEGQMLIP